MALASGYLFTALVIVPHLLTFPGAFTETGLLGAGLQSTVWLYIFWHLGLPPAVIAYALLKGKQDRASTVHAPVGRAIVASATAIAALVCVLTWLVTAGAAIIPPIMVDSMHASNVWHYYAAPPIIVLFIVSLAVLLLRRFSVLDLWLLVVLWAWFIETVLLSTTAYRFSVVWYAGRAFGLLSSCFVLLALLSESTLLYARLAVSVAARDRERQGRLMSMNALAASIAHEINQPLAAIVCNSEACIKLLAMTPPNLDEVRAALGDIIKDGRRSSEIVGSIKSTFKSGDEAKTPIDINEVIRDTIAILHAELQNQEVSVQLDLAAELPRIVAHRAHLQQVMLNLATNAIDAMASVTDRTRLLGVESKTDEAGGVSISVRDNGPGIDPENAERIFEVFFTTKPNGTGLGLAICRSLIENHHGRLWLEARRPQGCAFHVFLPREHAA